MDRRRFALPNRTLLILVLVVIFVGATSCGDLTGSDSKDKDAEIRALRQALANQQAGGQAATVYATTTVTALVQITTTSVSSSTATNPSGSTYTITSTTSGTGSSGSTSTSTASRL